MGRVYYNDNDDFVCAALEQLMRDGLIPHGDVDNRSILDVKASDLTGYTQCHFFAGAGGWALALALAGVSTDRPIWTGSCPCQPLSLAGSRKGHADERHLWPAFCQLISERRPPTVLGEQVASKDGLEWFAGVRADLEGDRYACGAINLCSAGAGAPHIRYRNYWVADSYGWREGDGELQRSGQQRLVAQNGGSRIFMGDTENLNGGGQTRNARSAGRAARICRSKSERCGPGPHRQCRTARTMRGVAIPPKQLAAQYRGRSGFIVCRDGKSRRIPIGPEIESLFFGMAHGIPGGVERLSAKSCFPVTAEKIENRLGILRVFGNAIDPILAAMFIECALEAVDEAG
jgi:DNA (cytosine-5)-methyltransferase 1